MSPDKVLLVDDDSDALLSLSKALRGAGLEAAIEGTSKSQTAEKLISSSEFDVLVLDLSLDPVLGVESGFTLLRTALQSAPHMRVIVLTGHGSLEYGIRALGMGAANFLEKPADISHLRELIRDGIRQSKLQRDFLKLSANNANGDRLEEQFVGSSDATKKVREAIRYAAQTSQAILIDGETGTGKGICARAIHNLSARSAKKFVRYQPSFGTSDLVNSDLFGHLKGAFTGADSDRQGLLEAANGGTVFLDEIDALPIETQVMLLGVLQEKSFRPVGSNTERKLDLRFVSATNRNLEESLAAGQIREDLFHRIAHFRISIPPLRERLDDLSQLARHFLQRLSEAESLVVIDISDAALDLLRAQSWPGNVRELEAVVEGAAYRAQFEGRNIVDVCDLEPRRHAAAGNQLSFHERVQNFKRDVVKQALAQNDNNQLRAAKELGIDRSTLRRILQLGD